VHELIELCDGWQAATSAPGACAGPRDTDGLEWHEARVPGTAADVLEALGKSLVERRAAALDEQDWWFRTTFAVAPALAGEELVLEAGLATLAEVYVDGELVLESESMFLPAAREVSGLIGERTELAICARALGPRLREPRRPRQRWRTRLVGESNLRFYRTMLLGRAPGFAPGPPIVGPWRGVRLQRRRALAVDAVRLRARIDGADGVLDVSCQLRTLGDRACAAVQARLSGHGSDVRVPLTLAAQVGGLLATGTLRVPEVVRWWPHTHGDPALYQLELVAEVDSMPLTLDAGRVGFRELVGPADLESEGLRLELNGVPIFARGALWTPGELAGRVPSAAEIRSAIEKCRAAGMNMLRIPGTAAYESAAFHDLCDELGMLVWQDFMFANLDYPESLPEFMASVADEARHVLGEVGGRPSLAVLCGSSELAQQVAMLGLDPSLASGPLFGELLPALVAEAELDAIYVPSAPWGGDLPFRPSRGVANYFGVGGYRRPLEDARRAEVRFASECLAIANVPDEPALAEIAPGLEGGVLLDDPGWKRGVPGDAGTEWDFEDVRDHYLAELFGVDPVVLRATDAERYLELSRAVSGELMAEVFGEWRRAASPCAGGLVLWLRDLAPGAGWGVLDHRGEPKVAYHHLRRALAPVAVWSSDEGLGGIIAHVANDSPEPLLAALRVALYAGLELCVERVTVPLELAPHSEWSGNIEELIGRFVDVSWAYRFGPPAQDVVSLSLERDRAGASELISQAFRLPAGRPLTRETDLGLAGTLERDRHSSDLVLALSTRRFAYGVRIHAAGFRADDDAFCIEPGGERRIRLRPLGSGDHLPSVRLTALNLRGSVAPEERP
jgi:beta-mannosidase